MGAAHAFDPNDVWVRAAETRFFRTQLLVEKIRKLALAIRLYPQRIPSLLRDRRTFDGVKPGDDHIDCSLGRIQIDNRRSAAQLREIAVSGAYSARGFIPRSGWTVVDVGANLGFFTCWAASWMLRGRLLAIEAVPETFAILDKNVRQLRNRGLDAKAVNQAVSDRKTLLEFAVPIGLSNYARSTTYIGRLAAFSDIPRRYLPADTLDNILESEGYMAGGRPIDLLKIDVEGSEVDCLAGATRTLGLTHHVVFEYHSSTLLARCGEQLSAAGFTQALTRPGMLSSELGVSFWRRR